MEYQEDFSTFGQFNLATWLKFIERKVYSGYEVFKVFKMLNEMLSYNQHLLGKERDFNPTVEILKELMTKLRTSQNGQTSAFVSNTA